MRSSLSAGVVARTCCRARFFLDEGDHHMRFTSAGTVRYRCQYCDCDLLKSTKLGALLPSSRYHGKTVSIPHDPDALRPRIELHPEDHIYREPSTQHLDWLVTSDYLRPDGVLKRVYLINGLFPGPTVETRSGDRLVITVTNALEDESITIHWHGLHVKHSMDGAAGVTQCVISPGTKFVYNFTIPDDQSGTFWYHAHSGLARADGLYGGFVVHAPASKSTVRGLLSARHSNEVHRHRYDKELLLLIGDWYHQPAEDVMAWYMRAASFGNEPVPDSLLINGFGSFDCSMAVPARPVNCIMQESDALNLDLDRTTVYRIRVVNTGSLAGFTLAFGQENMELVQIDSVDVEPQRQNVNALGILHPGQRMDFILRSPSENTQFSLFIQLDEECFKYPNPALAPNQTFPINAANTPQQPINTIHLDLSDVPSSNKVLSSLPATAQQTHVVYTRVQKLAKNSNTPYGYFNHTSWRPQSEPSAALVALPREKWDKQQFSLSTGDKAEWVDLVVNNLDDSPHPFHLHGHHFYILQVYQAPIGWGSYNPFSDPHPPGSAPGSNRSSYDLTKATLRDTVYIPSRGYAVLRFRADNPGVWMFHCHILWHLASGMAMLVDVMRDEQGSFVDGGSCLSTG
ncbi:hypothetical protein ASPWEDRAFT_51086 [Aspergillus wentii DTO 134E9]|uniref:Laccase n=1 Tax=Aspergillus wentii DTO 134E9 TaxID=1073089 RepID=A0A1L9RIS7_ASPWE|nr:uncharacterized protein ASPWEDRAFT_51086 [Aspergillus wentii DTO 134E9]OJJ34829.1 hypothetical protein ASPWEDRAFT_51086 [Aspergillus wentii DTO 134E9]